MADTGDTPISPEFLNEVTASERDLYAEIEVAKGEDFVKYVRWLATQPGGEKALAAIADKLRKRKTMCEQRVEQWQEKARELETQIKLLEGTK